MSELLSPHREPKELRPRTVVAGVIATLIFLALGARLYVLQIAQGDDLSRKSRENFKKELVEPAERGRILDHRGRVLADNRPSFDVYLTPAFSKRLDEVLERLAMHLNMSEEEVENVRRGLKRARGLERFRPYLVKLDVSWSQLMVIKADHANLEGVDVIDSPHREYCPIRAVGDSPLQEELEPAESRCDGELISHVVGYMSEVSPSEFEAGKGKYRRGDFIGRRGIERALESELRGQDGRLRKAVDAKGRELEDSLQKEYISEDQRRVPSKPGNNVVLSLDLGLQSVADRAMKEGAQAGALVAVDVHTGYVLAMVSHPAYDPNKMTGRISRRDLKAIVDDPLEPLFQRAIQQHYHPGSVFKIVTALAALKSGEFTADSHVGCPGHYSLGSRRWRCWKDSGHGGGINLKTSLKISCDVWYYWVAHKLGLDPIASMARELGFGKTTGLELSPETPGLIPDEAWHRRVEKHYTTGFALNASIGQGSVNVTPLQVAMAFAAIGNGGTLYRPKLVRRVESPEGEVVKSFSPEVVRELGVSQAALNSVMQGLTAVVQEPGGTAYHRRLADVTAAGKTGTAQVVHLGKERIKTAELEWKHRDHAWFAVLAPAEEPEIAVVVINEHGGGGSSVAAPIAMATVQGYFDIKKKEAEARRALTNEEILAIELTPRRPGSTPLRAVASPRPAPVVLRPQVSENEPVSTAAEVADPTLLRSGGGQ